MHFWLRRVETTTTTPQRILWHPKGWLAAALVLLMVTGCSSSEDNSEPAGPRTDEELAIAWWEWATSEPEETNAVTDDTGEYCDRNQPDDVWFLANTFGNDATRSCTIPQTDVFFPILNVLCGGNGACTTDYDDAEIEVTLDGEPVTALEIDTSPGEITMEEGNPLEPDGGEFRVVAAGWWVRLPPLDPGEHVLAFAGTGNAVDLSVQYALSVTE